MTTHLDPTVTMICVDWDDPRAVDMRRAMDEEIAPRYAGRLPAEVTAKANVALGVNPIDVRATVLAIDAEGTPIAHAVLREIRGDWEVKRVVVAAAARGRGVGIALMGELEKIATAAGKQRLILQTGDRQPEAVALYTRLGYTPIPTYEPYLSTIPFSICLEKTLA